MKKQILSILLCLIIVSPDMAQTMFTHPWQGKRVAYLGDSITDPNHKAAGRKYWNCLQEWLGITPFVYAISGRQWNDIPRQAEKLRTEHGDDFDAIIIFIGTNDFNAGVPVGTWFTEREEDIATNINEPQVTEKRRRLHPVMSDSTYCGRINIALSTVKKMFPCKQIIVMTPIHRSFYISKAGKWQQPDSYCNKNGEYLSAYIEASKACGNIWSVPVIDLNALCGLNPSLDEHRQYFKDEGKDLLHPNDKGHERMARTIMYGLLALPCGF
ncbi:SGNH/GDSL hydrolase family protein [Prevotella sp. PCHR]|uniref:SGNH/GDSL hydrolase family protein n=2 Tax=Xylanibacter caecicola TaxID=2736294 RepID=A0ABX2B454_9BACT|nr:SGNH/GDSL hydrolase family protein [Xylanibacter caecicola]NPE26053.1 SGNH/GDSL hydrolase family protein [Xylanibacter caecicola]